MRYDESDIHGERYMYLHAKRLFREVSATCMEGSVTVCVHLPASLSVSLSVYNNLLNLMTLND